MFYQEDYIIKGVDLVSGIGGAVGLYLGWSLMSFGMFLIDAIKSLKYLFVKPKSPNSKV